LQPRIESNHHVSPGLAADVAAAIRQLGIDPEKADPLAS
jgi:hypothetical protein